MAAAMKSLGLESSEQAVSVLVAAPESAELAKLRSLFVRLGWTLLEARNCRETVRLLCHARVPVILCDQSFADGNWKDLLSHVAPMLDAPAIVVMLGENDALAWAEVLEMGGYDVLMKPLQDTEVVHVVECASRRARTVDVRTGARIRAAAM